MCVKLFKTKVLTLFWALCLVGILPSYAQKTTEDWQTGKATFYHKKFYGRHTASGERLRPHLLTAAHRTLPFGTRVRVVHKQTGKSIIVRINDRGPHAKGCVIDLTKAGAQKLGIQQGAGSSLVIVQPLTEPNVKEMDQEQLTDVKGQLPKESDDKGQKGMPAILGQEGVYGLDGKQANPKGYALQVAAYYCPESALYEAKSLARAGFGDVFLQVHCTEKEEPLYRVMVGQYPSRKLALAARPNLAAKGWEGTIINVKFKI
jgi:rare lipoprotein A